MDELLLYTNICLSCREYNKMSTIMQFAKNNGIRFITKRTYMFPELKEEASTVSELTMPFLSYKDKSISFYLLSSRNIDNELLKLIQ